MKTKKIFFTALVIVAITGCKKEDKSTPATPSTPTPTASEYIMTINDGSGTITMQEGVSHFANGSFIDSGVVSVPVPGINYDAGFLYEDTSGVSNVRGVISFDMFYTTSQSPAQLDAMYSPGQYNVSGYSTQDSTVSVSYTESNNTKWRSSNVASANQSGNVTIASVENITDTYSRKKVKGTFTCQVASSVGGTTKTITGSFTTRLGTK